MKHRSLKPGDTIVAVGYTTSDKGILESHEELCKVIGTGKKDVVAQTSSGRVFSIPESRCILVREIKEDPSSKVLSPKIGDLVLSVTERFSKIEKKMGVLIEITDTPGKIKMVTLLQGEKREYAPYDSLIVLE